MDDEQYKVKYIKLTKSIIISYGNVSVPLDISDPRYPLVLEAIKNDDLNSIPGIIHVKEINKIKDFLKIKKKD